MNSNNKDNMLKTVSGNRNLAQQYLSTPYNITMYHPIQYMPMRIRTIQPRSQWTMCTIS